MQGLFYAQSHTSWCGFFYRHIPFPFFKESVMTNGIPLYGKYKSPCCGGPQLIVRSRDGGFITQNCETCERPHLINAVEIPAVECEPCSKPMEICTDGYGTYQFRCPNCKKRTYVYELVPWWHERFKYYGVATPNERCY